MKKIIKIILGIISCILLSFLTSCDRTLEIQQSFPFKVEIMPVPKTVSNGNVVEIRCKIIPEKEYAHTQYFIRYFQFDGKGYLCIEDANAMLPSDIYKLPNKTFRLYYKSLSEVPQMFSVWISDSFGNEQKIDFEFGNISKNNTKK